MVSAYVVDRVIVLMSNIAVIGLTNLSQVIRLSNKEEAIMAQVVLHLAIRKFCRER